MPHTHILGAGVIGLSTAYYLTEAGHRVTVVDRGPATHEGTSHGNAGMIVPSHIVPMAAPGVIRRGLRWMLDPSSPFYIRPRLDWDLIQWLWAFQRSATAQHVDQSMPVLFALHEKSKALYQAFAKTPGFDFGFGEVGLLMLYKSAHQAKEEAVLAKQAAAVGMRAELLDLAGVQRLEPELDLDVLGGVYFPGDAHLYPNVFLLQLKQHLERQGVAFIHDLNITSLIAEDDRVRAMTTPQGDLAVDELVVAAGSWSSALLKTIGVRLLLQDGKGYSITLAGPPVGPRIPTILTESKVAVTPMGQDLRIGGTLEISGLSPKLNRRRVRAIVDSVPRYFRNVEVPYNEQTPVWTGYRPCSPDGLPYIGRPDGWRNVSVGTGHGMMGLSLGPVTGHLLTELIGGRVPSLGLEAFRVGR